MIGGFLLLAALAFAQGSSSIVDTKHNLSSSGPGDIRALNEDRVCVFCHTPHNARDVAPLWNRRDSQAAYTPYYSPTLKASPGQPTGSSKLCLSCHDGTIAMGDLVSESMPIAMTGGGMMPAGAGLIGTDLRDDHPISFLYDESLMGGSTELRPTASWDPRVKLDQTGMLQCTTCHDPHDDQWGRFLVMENAESSLCRQCHAPEGYEQSAHALSPATWNGAGTNPWPHTNYTDVRTNACMNCHRSHHADGMMGLLTHRQEEEVCLACHDGSVARDNMRPLFQKPFSHPVALTTGVHEAGEDPLSMPRHVECVDCHNPHRARRGGPSQPPMVMGALEGVSGVSALGIPVDEALYEYEVCFKCHAQESFGSLSPITRQIQTSDASKEFSTASPSYHPVVAPGKNSFVPSLLPPLNEGSMIYCSDCHGTEESPGSGAKGPHGSIHEFMLVREYRTGSDITESLGAYALCYGCHSRSSILANESFAGHYRHVVDERTSCATCHDAHGIDYTRGNAMNNSNLMNFDVNIVEPDPVTGRLEYISLGPGSGECYLRCHGKNHSPESY